MADPAPFDPFDFLRRLWTPMGVPMASSMSAIPGMMFPTANVDEIDKRIADLRAVEGWLSLNLEMLRATIQGLEAQKATLATFQSMQQSATQAAVAATAPQRRAAKRRKA